jgi:hypothetical protein
MKTWGSAPPFLPSPADGGGRSASRPSRSSPIFIQRHNCGGQNMARRNLNLTLGYDQILLKDAAFYHLFLLFKVYDRKMAVT